MPNVGEAKWFIKRCRFHGLKGSTRALRWMDNVANKFHKMPENIGEIARRSNDRFETDVDNTIPLFDSDQVPESGTRN